MEPQLVLVVDDEPKLVKLVREVLTAVGYRVIATGRGEKAVELTALEQPDLLLLDIVLADDLSGYDVARRVREFSDVPIIMLTARAKESDLLSGFEAGADDYLTKPFSSKELLVRLKAVLRRANLETPDQGAGEIQCGEVRIELSSRRVFRGEEPIHLSRTEFNLLRELALHPNQVLNHEQLLSKVWGDAYRDDIEYLRAYIRYLRKKIEQDPSQPKRILTCQGVGYMLACPEASG